MALHPDGTVWATGANKEARQLFPDKVEFKFYESPNAKKHPLPGAYGIAVAGDGSVWYAEDEADQMVRIDPATGKTEAFKIPYEGHAYPRRMNTDANGDLWVALWNAGKLMKVDYKTRQMTIYSPPTQTGGNYSVVVDKKNNYIWVSEHQVDMIARFDPKTRNGSSSRCRKPNPIRAGSTSTRPTRTASSSAATPRAAWASSRCCRSRACRPPLRTICRPRLRGDDSRRSSGSAPAVRFLLRDLCLGLVLGSGLRLAGG